MCPNSYQLRSMVNGRSITLLFVTTMNSISHWIIIFSGIASEDLAATVGLGCLYRLEYTCKGEILKTAFIFHHKNSTA